MKKHTHRVVSKEQKSDVGVIPLLVVRPVCCRLLGTIEFSGYQLTALLHSPLTQLPVSVTCHLVSGIKTQSGIQMVLLE